MMMMMMIHSSCDVEMHAEHFHPVVVPGIVDIVLLVPDGRNSEHHVEMGIAYKFEMMEEGMLRTTNVADVVVVVVIVIVRKIASSDGEDLPSLTYRKTKMLSIMVLLHDSTEWHHRNENLVLTLCPEIDISWFEVAVEQIAISFG